MIINDNVINHDNVINDSVHVVAFLWKFISLQIALVNCWCDYEVSFTFRFFTSSQKPQA